MNIQNFLFKLLISTILSGILGFEREKVHKPIGLRTIIYTCNSATIFTLISQYLYQFYNMDFSRIIAYIIAGIGFLGSGILIKRGQDIEGGTTAICLWIILAIGILVGLGLYIEAVILTIHSFILLEIKGIPLCLNKILKFIIRKKY